MPVTIRWFNDEKTIILYDVQNPWSWDDFDAALHQSFEMIASLDYPVDAILDVHAGRKLPSGALTQGSKILKELRKQENTGIAVYVGAPDFLKMIIQTFNRIYQQNDVQIFFADDYDNATLIITDYRANL